MKIKDKLVAFYKILNTPDNWYAFEVGIYCFLVALFAFIPQTGFITIDGITISFLSVFVIVAAIRRGYIAGLLTGFVYGVVSFIVAILARNFQIYFPKGIYYVFCNFLVAVIPRVILGLLTALLYKAFSEVFKKFWFSIPLIAIINLLIHLFLCVLCAFIFYPGMLAKLFGDNAFIQIIFYRKNYYYIIEVLLSATISTVICFVNASFARKKALFEG